MPVLVLVLEALLVTPAGVAAWLVAHPVAQEKARPSLRSIRKQKES
ncbi:hypothetical protein LN042_12300 [Kitasatospora sp. RB6PN24]|nr:hypothetical protein [Kitasatospora humi]MCC9307864.1 hypothetical protein [Kitasatospora humi]